jgi:hypothetical protein
LSAERSHPLSGRIKNVKTHPSPPAAQYLGREPTRERGGMDLVVIAIVIGFFLISAVVVGLLDRL